SRAPPYGEDRIEAPHDLVVSANDHAVAALTASDAPAGADIDAFQSFRRKLARPADVILVNRIAAIDNDVARLEQVGKLPDGCFRDLSRRKHDPDVARSLLAIMSLRLAAADAPSSAKCQTRSGLRS
ncbi:hypothetical protein E4T56_gene6585, partial [Termitomyces sp. T112]